MGDAEILEGLKEKEEEFMNLNSEPWASTE
jgi:hypothetical protein